MEKVKICVIVLNYNDYTTTSEFIERWIKQKISLDYRLIIVDNHSSDDSFNKLYERYSDIFDIIQTKENGGYAVCCHCITAGTL